jgi:hypothetical protein
MEQFITEIERDAAMLGMSPQHLLRKAVGASWKTWADWVVGKSTPTLATVDRIRAWVSRNKPANHTVCLPSSEPAVDQGLSG